MISFRFHLVSLIAVFLALGLGVLIGTTVINRALVSRLEDQTNSLVAQADQMRSRLDGWTRFGDAIAEREVDGALAQTDVVVVTEEGTDESAIDGATSGLDQAGARVMALLQVDGAIAGQNEADRDALAEAIGSDRSADPEELERAAANALATRLAFGPDTDGSDVLEELIASGFVSNSGDEPLDEEGLQALSGAEVVVVVGGGSAASGLQPDAFLLPFVEALTQARTPAVAAVESFTAEEPFVELLCDDADVSTAVTTQDNVDQVYGQVGFVLALRDLVDGREPGHYGVKGCATDVIPPA